MNKSEQLKNICESLLNISEAIDHSKIKDGDTITGVSAGTKTTSKGMSHGVSSNNAPGERSSEGSGKVVTGKVTGFGRSKGKNYHVVETPNGETHHIYYDDVHSHDSK